MSSKIPLDRLTRADCGPSDWRRCPRCGYVDLDDVFHKARYPQPTGEREPERRCPSCGTVGMAWQLVFLAQIGGSVLLWPDWTALRPAPPQARSRTRRKR